MTTQPTGDLASSPPSHGSPGRLLTILASMTYSAAEAIRRLDERIAASAGQTEARRRILRAIAEGECTTPTVAHRIHRSLPAVRRIVNELVDEGVVMFITNPQPGGARFVCLTKSGAETLVAIDCQRESEYRMLMHQLRNVDVAGLVAGLELFTRAAGGPLDTRASAPMCARSPRCSPAID
jgi:DNA-binding MarR family transcriptional regulator